MMVFNNTKAVMNEIDKNIRAFEGIAEVRPSPGKAAPVTVPVYAALDLGTNNCRLLIAISEPPGFRVIDTFSRIVRLGEGLATEGKMSERAMHRAFSALRLCQEKMALARVNRTMLIATEACRAASNGAEFLNKVRDELGLNLTIVERETEARLAVRGCELLIDPNAESAVIFDIGGGSTELAYLKCTPGEIPKVVDWMSLPFGVVTLAERYGGAEVSPETFAEMTEEVAKVLDTFPGREQISRAARNSTFHLLGTSGTVTTVAGMHLGLRRYDRRRVDGLWMQDQDVAAVIEELLVLSYEERMKNACIGHERADLVLAGCAIFEAIRSAFPSKRVRVADRGLREGLLIEMMRADGFPLNDPEAPGIRPGDMRLRRPMPKRSIPSPLAGEGQGGG
jgi:exopolyphosphatase/guanosine-5'-triphosphate,3'-diphosphate pyrophosphatase